MLAVSPLRNPKNDRESEMESFPMDAAEFPDFSGGNLLDSIDFDDIFIGISDGDCLPDLVMDPELLSAFSLTDSDHKIPSSVKSEDENTSPISLHHQHPVSGSGSGLDIGSGQATLEEERGAPPVSKMDDEVTTVASLNNNQSPTKSDKAGRKSTANSKNPPGVGAGKRKVKVDWTPDLHRRFVQAVEQLGVDKAVPSRILELMGIDCLTRHNIASHLQKYRSHRKHLLAREAEAASWGQRRQATFGGGGGGGGAAGKRDLVNSWIAPTLGFPPPVTPIPHFRPPLHVWGHPSVDQSMIHMWPKHQTPPPPQAWPAPHRPADPSFWIPHHQVATPGTPCFPPHLTPTTFPTPPVAGIPPPSMIKVEPGIAFPTVRPPSDVHPSKETVDAAIGDVLSKPWLPLPLGLKPPSVDSVMVELQRQGISRVPPTCG